MKNKMDKTDTTPHWNYRVIKEYDPLYKTTVYQVHEVYYSPDGNPEYWSDSILSPNGETLEKLNKDLLLFRQALERPVLMEKEINGKLILVEAKNG